MGSVSNDEFNTLRDDLHNFGPQSGNRETAQLTTVGRDRDGTVSGIGYMALQGISESRNEERARSHRHVELISNQMMC